MLKNKLVGKWALVVCEARDVANKSRILFYPWGQNAKGHVTYYADKSMVLFIEKEGRKKFENIDPEQASTLEKAQAFDSLFCYTGSFECTSASVMHKIEMASFPNFSNTIQERFVQVNKEQLLLTSAPTMHSGQAMYYHVEWQRCNKE